MILEEELIHLLPQVYQANAMSDELKKDMKFEIVLVAPQARGLKSGQTEVRVQYCKSSNMAPGATTPLWRAGRTRIFY